MTQVLLVNVADSCWLVSYSDSFKLNFDVVWLDGDVGIGVILRDKNIEVMIAMENHLSLTGSIEFAEAIVMFNGIYKAIETDISPLWVNTDSNLESPDGE